MSTPPGPSTLDIMVQITRLEAKLDQVIATIPKDVEDHETRLRAIEKKVWALPTAAGVINFLMLIVAYFSMHH